MHHRAGFWLYLRCVRFGWNGRNVRSSWDDLARKFLGPQVTPDKLKKQLIQKINNGIFSIK
jgi:hypothetical protein